MTRKYLPPFIGMLSGAAGGFAYHHYAGCPGGTCPITSSPCISTLYGAMMGGLLISLFKK